MFANTKSFILSISFQKLIRQTGNSVRKFDFQIDLKRSVEMRGVETLDPTATLLNNPRMESPR
jgi:hypothetical protein